MRLVVRQHGQHMRRLDRPIRLHHRDQLDRAVILIGPIGPAVVAVGGVNVPDVGRDPLALVVDPGLDTDRAGNRYAVIVCGFALRISRDFGGGEIAVDRFVCVVGLAVVALLGLLVFHLDELQPDFRGDRAALVIGGFDFDLRIVVLVVDVFFRAREDYDVAARADEAGLALLHSTRRVGDLGFQTVGEIVRLGLVQRRNVERDFQASLRVQPPFALFHHVVAVALITGAVALFAFASAYAVVVLIAEPPVVIARAIDVILHVAVGHGRAEEVFRLDGELGLFADGHEIFRGRDLDLVFGLLVFGHLERAAGLSAVEAGDDRIIAERRARGQIDLAAERPARRER